MKVMIMNIKKYLLCALLIFFFPVVPKHDVKKTTEVYNAIKNDVYLFKNYQILKRGWGYVIVHDTGGRAPRFKRGDAGSKYKYSLANRKLVIAKSEEYYKDFGFNDEHSFMAHFSSIIDKYESLNLLFVEGYERRDIPGLISITVTPNDVLYYYPDSLKIPIDFYESALARGELSRLDGNWFYVKRRSPVKAPW